MNKQGTTNNINGWTSAQVYVLAVICLVAGVAAGYLLRGSAAPPVAAASTEQPDPHAGVPGGGKVPTMDQLNSAIMPLMQELEKDPKNVDVLVKLGNLYYDHRGYQQSVKFYERALEVKPDLVPVRTDMGTAYYYLGDADRALAEFQKSLTYDPKHAQTLFNIGIVKLQAKNDAKGAVAAWEQLIAQNPGHPEVGKIKEMIADAKKKI